MQAQSTYSQPADAILLANASLPDAPQPDASLLPQQTPPTQPNPDSSSSATPNASSDKPAQKEQSEKELQEEEHQRMLGVVPTFSVVMNGQAHPLTAGQKYRLWFRSSIDPFTFGGTAIFAGIEQARDSFPGYGQGFEGYAKRYGASYADTVDGGFWGNAVLPAIFHQDPRYFRLGKGSINHRFWYSVSAAVRCKGDNGHWQFNYSNIAGNFIGGGISNLYYPAEDRGVALTFERGAVVTAEGVFGPIAYEFYPDAIAYLKRHFGSKPKAAPPAASQPTAATP
jgi:hypothetical protein